MFRNTLWKYLLAGLFLLPNLGLASGGFSPSMGAKNSESFNQGKAIINGKAGIPGCKSCHAKWSRSEVKKFLPNIDEILSGGHLPALEHSYTEAERKAIHDFLKARYRVR